MQIFKAEKKSAIDFYKANVYKRLGLSGNDDSWGKIIENHYKNGYSEESSARILQEVYRMQYGEK